MEVRNGGKLQIGDLIAIASGNYMDIGLYAGTGRGTIQFYNLGSIGWCINQRALGKEAKLYKSYINSPHMTRTIKLTPECLTNQDDIKAYEQGIELLKQLGIIKN